MKDTEARKKIGGVEAELRGLKFEVSRLEVEVDASRRCIRNLRDLTVKNCPKCKHIVIARPPGNHECAFDTVPAWTCLTCGEKFTCTEEQVCRLIKEG